MASFGLSHIKIATSYEILPKEQFYEEDY